MIMSEFVAYEKCNLHEGGAVSFLFYAISLVLRKTTNSEQQAAQQIFTEWMDMRRRTVK